MANLLDFKTKREDSVAGSLKTFSSIIDTAITYIIKRPHVSKKEIVGFMAERLAKFISICPYNIRDQLLAVAITTLQKYYKPTQFKNNP